MEHVQHAESSPVSWLRDLRRWAYAGVGLLSVGLAWVGAVVPGLPTTIFLIIASYCFTRSCPWLERRLLRVPVFARYMTVIDQRGGLSRRAAVGAALSMWTCVGVSVAILLAAGVSTWIAGGVIAAAVIGTGVIALWARRPVERADL